MYSQLAGKLFYFPLEAVLFDVPSYQLCDVAEIYWAMRDRNRQIFEHAINQGMFNLYFEMKNCVR